MKSLLKLIAVVAVLGFVSCTDNTEKGITNDEILQQDEFGTDKKDITNPNNGGQNDHDFDEE
ncbi:hypothetical protein BTO06_00915 [Tenacibaculum sp. SZ-18]|uniref:hypothetical protein n=1 Tax=Tenacibaculum sp. SZ-18 TaxID=754423 RepID=UPI000C2D3FA4|nr:hypothetical protein [Tenacibaculum sp. SZ-18]AUC13795.1 hypothetical protein BTO06_00915 [Tenacibaculum sp. SZ-18]